MFHGRNHTEITHQQRILYDERPDIAIFHYGHSQSTSLIVIRRYEADVFIGLEVRIHDYDRDAGFHRVLDRFDQRLGIERGQNHRADVASHEILDHLDLLIAIILAQRPLPDDVNFRPLRP